MHFRMKRCRKSPEASPVCASLHHGRKAKKARENQTMQQALGAGPLTPSESVSCSVLTAAHPSG